MAPRAHKFSTPEATSREAITDPLQRLLGGSGVIELNNGAGGTEFGVKHGLPWIAFVA